MAKVIEITNPLTGQPQSVIQSDYTAQQIDDAVGAVMSSASSPITLSENFSSYGTCNVSKILNKVCVLNIAVLSSNQISAGQTVVGTIPSNYFPQSTIYAAASIGNSGSPVGSAEISISENGEITIYSPQNYTYVSACVVFYQG